MSKEISINENLLPPIPLPKKKIIIYGLILSSGGLYYGLTVGMFNNFFFPFIENVLQITDPDLQIEINSNFAFIYFIGCLSAALTSSLIYEKMGRLKAFYLAILFEVIGSFCLIIKSVNIIYLGRFINGYFGCFWMFLSHLMIKEMIDKKYRVTIANSFYVFITIGMILSFSIGTEDVLDYYQFYLCLPIFFEIPRALILACFFCMESPVFLYYKYRNHHSIKELIKKNYKIFYNDALSEIKTADFIAQKKAMEIFSKKKVKLSDMFTKNHRKQLSFGIFINMMTQLTGINVLTVFSNEIFKSIESKKPEFLTSIMAFFYFFGAIFITLFGSKIGKRKPILKSFIFQGISWFLVILGYLFKIRFLTIFSIYSFCFFFTIFAGIHFSYLVAILPPIALSFASILKWCIVIFLLKYILFIIESIGLIWIFLFFMLMSFLGAFIFWGFSIKIKNKTESEIFEEFKNKKFLI